MRGHCDEFRGVLRMRLRDARGRTMTAMTQSLTVRRIAVTRMPTKWGVFQTMAFEREIPRGADIPVCRSTLCRFWQTGMSAPQVETALALVLGDLTEGAPLVRI